MVVRFDGQRVQQTVEQRVEPIGVEGDPASQKGGISEAEAIVLEQKQRLENTGEAVPDANPSEMLADVNEEEAPDPGPELKPEALEAARKDKKPQPLQ